MQNPLPFLRPTKRTGLQIIVVSILVAAANSTACAGRAPDPPGDFDIFTSPTACLTPAVIRAEQPGEDRSTRCVAVTGTFKKLDEPGMRTPAAISRRFAFIHPNRISIL